MLSWRLSAAPILRSCEYIYWKDHSGGLFFTIIDMILTCLGIFLASARAARVPASGSKAPGLLLMSFSTSVGGRRLR